MCLMVSFHLFFVVVVSVAGILAVPTAHYLQPSMRLQSTQWWKLFGEIECLALMIACVCHDLDHRGTNNSFQIK